MKKTEKYCDNEKRLTKNKKQNIMNSVHIMQINTMV